MDKGETERVSVLQSLDIIYVPRTLNPKASCRLIMRHASDVTVIHEYRRDKKELVIRSSIDIYYRWDKLLRILFKQGLGDRKVFRGPECSKTFFFRSFPTRHMDYSIRHIVVNCVRTYSAKP